MRYKEIISEMALSDMDSNDEDLYKSYSRSLQRAGMIPYYIFDIDGGKIPKIFLMKPLDPAYGGTKFQVAKGRIEDGLSAEETAFKECEEELGCLKSNFDVSTLKKIATEPFNTFICKVKNPNGMVEPHYETGEVRWVSLNELKLYGREQQMSLMLKAFKEISK